MWRRNTLKVALSATKLDLAAMMSDDLELPKDKRLGAAILTASKKNFSANQLERAGEIVSHYLEASVAFNSSKAGQLGPFIFNIGRDEELLSFIRDIESELQLYDECDYMKIELRFE